MKKFLLVSLFLFALVTPASTQNATVAGPAPTLSTQLSDVTAAGPGPATTDSSGAGLVFTSVTVNFSKGNKTCVGNFRLTFPATADASNAQVTLPCTVANNGSPTIGLCFSTALSPNGTIVLLGVANSANAQLLNLTGGAAQTKNVDLTSKVLSCMFSFITT